MCLLGKTSECAACGVCPAIADERGATMLYSQEEGGMRDGQELPAAAVSLEETSFSSIDSSLNDEIQVCAQGNADVLCCALREGSQSAAVCGPCRLHASKARRWMA